MKDLSRSDIRAVAMMAVPALIVGLALEVPTSARAQVNVRNTYNGAQCLSRLPGAANNLIRDRGIVASLPTEVICPIVKTIFNSTAGVTVAVAASGGTACRLESFDVFSTNVVASPTQTFPGTGISGLDFSINQSLRGGMQVRCFLRAQGTILNYLVREAPLG